MVRQDDLFFREGLRLFAEARSTLVHFQSLAEGRIRDVLMRLRDWGKFRPASTPISVKTGTYSNAIEGTWINGVISGRDSAGNGLALVLGISWDWPLLEPLIVYGGFSGTGSKGILPTSPDPARPRIKVTPQAQWPRLYVVPEAEPDITADLELVIGEILRYVR
ncbi:MAG: hypothetical protein PHU25_08470 [Deltaproteobacteria bacterium]|nr:hypothetical protein [Deltaproteobacteria bacterium]